MTRSQGASPVYPYTEFMEKDPELGVIWGNHPDADRHTRAHIQRIVCEKKGTAFAYDVQQLGTYTGEVGPYRIEL